MKVAVTMEIDFGNCPSPDERGSVDVWIKNALQDALNNDGYEEGQQPLYKVLKLKWKII